VTEIGRAALVLVVSAAAIVITFVYFFIPFMREQPHVQDVLNANSTWGVAMQVYELTGPLSAETYRVTNDNGKVTMFYSATNRAATETKEFNVPLFGPNATFLFEELRNDGIWELDDRAMLPHPIDEYIIEVDQTLGDEGGTRSFGFSDPRYWANTNVHEYELKLPPKGPITGINAATLGVVGRQLREPRYLEIVEAIRGFGPQNVIAAESKIRSELAATALHPIPPR